MSAAATSVALLTVAEVAERLNVHAHTVYRAIAAGRLPASRITPYGPYRIDPDDLEAFLHAGRNLRRASGRHE